MKVRSGTEVLKSRTRYQPKSESGVLYLEAQRRNVAVRYRCLGQPEPGFLQDRPAKQKTNFYSSHTVGAFEKKKPMFYKAKT